ncbi:outer membrane protein assembly factor BamE [Oxalobacteraceae bacterium OM1]|nr:outer membrane protein assembly factor BamE [Oxalobacteraceae bacterium OM1]
MDGGAAKPNLEQASGTDAATASAGIQTVEPSAFQRFINYLKPYRIDVQQGNFVSQQMLAQLRDAMKNKEGVTPDQVRFILGTPLLNDVFHNERWDYPFLLKKRSGEIISSRVTVYFKGGRVSSVEGDQLPPEEQYLNLIAGQPAPKK